MNKNDNLNDVYYYFYPNGESIPLIFKKMGDLGILLI